MRAAQQGRLFGWWGWVGESRLPAAVRVACMLPTEALNYHPATQCNSSRPCTPRETAIRFCCTPLVLQTESYCLLFCHIRHSLPQS